MQSLYLGVGERVGLVLEPAVDVATGRDAHALGASRWSPRRAPTTARELDWPRSWQDGQALADVREQYAQRRAAGLAASVTPSEQAVVTPQPAR